MTKESAKQIVEELHSLPRWQDYADKFVSPDEGVRNPERSLLWAVYSSVFKQECVEWYTGETLEDAKKKCDEILPVVRLLESQGISISVKIREIFTSRNNQEKPYSGQILISVGYLESKK